jgi:hypothetical protein
MMQFAPEQGATLPVQRRLLEILDTTHGQPAVEVRQSEILSLCENLAEGGQERQAVDLLEQLTRRLPHLPVLRLRLARMLYHRQQFAEAVPLLEGLLEEPSCRIEAHFLLGDYYGREARAREALQQYEAVLALDFTYPRAAQRAKDLRSRLDRPLAAAAPTILGADDLGPGSRFLLQRELGRGGSGTVYLALDRSLDRPVAVKALHRGVRRRPDAWTHVFCEARIAAALRHPGIVAIYDLDEPLSLVVMEYCAGGTLADRMARGPVSLDETLGRLAEVCGVLDTVHRCGVVHRDLKPGNLLCRRAEEGGLPPLVISDFGIAHAGCESVRDEPAVGSLLYMAPEQRRGEATDHRADLCSCGVILLEMLLGRPPLDPQQARLGAPVLEMAEVWREARDLTPAAIRTPLVSLARSLVHPAVEERPADAAQVSARLAALADAHRAERERQQLLADLRERAGPGPWSAAVEEWMRGLER